MPIALVQRLREALIGVAERQCPDDPLPCFCVRSVHDVSDEMYEDVHDAWCEDARSALAETIALKIP